MTPAGFSLISQVSRVPSMAATLNAWQDSRFQRLVEGSIIIDPEQSIDCVLDHVAIGADTNIGDMVDLSRVMPGRTGPTPHLNGLESPGGRQVHHPRAHSRRQRLTFFRRTTGSTPFLSFPSPTRRTVNYGWLQPNKTDGGALP